jgi:hypothetical protein
MSKNYKFIINPSPPDPERIRKHQNFDALLGQYEASRKRTGRLRVLYVSSAVAASLLLLISFFWISESGVTVPYEQAAKAHFASQPFVNPPINDLEVPASITLIEAALGDTLTFQTGSQLIIPAQAFVNQNGEPVNGEVDIQFKEMHDFVDFFISGIPMHYDSNEIRYQLESAGMIEVLGFQNGAPVQLAADKRIEVELVSRVQMPRINSQPPKYNIYRLNIDERRWEYAGIDRLQIITEENPPDQTFFDQLKANFQAVIQQIEQNAQQNIRDLEASYPLPEKPLAPIEQRRDVPTLSLDFYDGIEEVEFYEGSNEQLAKIQNTFNGAIFQLAPNSASVNLPEVMETVWQSARIEALNEQEFEITLIHEDREARLRVVPVLGSSGYQEALEDYEQKMEAFKQAVLDRDVVLRDRIDRIRRDKEELIAKERLQFEATVQEMIDEGRINPEAMGTFKIVNRFSVDQFGIWNCDRPVAPDENVVPIQLIDQDGKKIKGKTTFVASKKRNTVYQFLATNNTPIPFLDDAEYLIWVVSEDNQLSLLKTVGKTASGTKDQIRLEVASRPIESEAELREVLYF